jgi:hypothetical protein
MATTSGSWARRAGAAVGAAVLLGLGAGCGGGGGGNDAGEAQARAAYEAKLKSEGSRLKTAFSAADIGEAENFAALAKALRHLQAVLVTTAHDLDTLQAPKDAAVDDARLAVLYRKAAAKVGQQVGAAKADDEQRLDRLNEQVDEIMNRARTATGDLKSKGYQIGVLGEH